MPASQPYSRLLIALLVSCLLHLMMLKGAEIARLLAAGTAPAAIPLLQARLLPPSDSALLKNTLTDGDETRLSWSLPARSPPAHAASRLSPQRHAQRKLAEHLFYPAEAIAKGLEGDVRLLLTLDQDGGILDAQVVSSSGHRLLDQAALDAAHAMRRVPNTGMRELILPVEFRLQ